MKKSKENTKQSTNRLSEVKFYMKQNLTVSKIAVVMGVKRQVVEYYIKRYKLSYKQPKKFKA